MFTPALVIACCVLYLVATALGLRILNKNTTRLLPYFDGTRPFLSGGKVDAVLDATVQRTRAKQKEGTAD